MKYFFLKHRQGHSLLFPSEERLQEYEKEYLIGTLMFPTACKSILHL